MSRCSLLAAVLLLAWAAPGRAEVRLVALVASPFAGLNSHFEVAIFLDRPGQAVALRLLALPDDGDERPIGCWQAADRLELAAGSADCPGLPDDELAGGTVVVEILRSLPLGRYRFEAAADGGAPVSSEIVDTRSFPAIVARRLGPGRAATVPVFGGSVRGGGPETIDGVSGARRLAVEARTEGSTITVEPAPKGGAVFELLGADGLLWSTVSAEPRATYDGPALAPGDYLWLVRAADPETIVTVRAQPRLHIPK